MIALVNYRVHNDCLDKSSRKLHNTSQKIQNITRKCGNSPKQEYFLEPVKTWLPRNKNENVLTVRGLAWTCCVVMRGYLIGLPSALLK